MISLGQRNAVPERRPSLAVDHLGWRRDPRLPAPTEGVLGALQPLDSRPCRFLCRFHQGVGGWTRNMGTEGWGMKWCLCGAGAGRWRTTKNNGGLQLRQQLSRDWSTRRAWFCSSGSRACASFPASLFIWRVVKREVIRSTCQRPFLLLPGWRGNYKSLLIHS